MKVKRHCQNVTLDCHGDVRSWFLLQEPQARLWGHWFLSVHESRRIILGGIALALNSWYCMTLKAIKLTKYFPYKSFLTNTDWHTLHPDLFWFNTVLLDCTGQYILKDEHCPRIFGGFFLGGEALNNHSVYHSNPSHPYTLVRNKWLKSKWPTPSSF